MPKVTDYRFYRLSDRPASIKLAALGRNAAFRYWSGHRCAYDPFRSNRGKV